MNATAYAKSLWKKEDYDHSTCMYYNHSTCMYYDHARGHCKNSVIWRTCNALTFANQLKPLQNTILYKKIHNTSSFITQQNTLWNNDTFFEEYFFHQNSCFWNHHHNHQQHDHQQQHHHVHFISIIIVVITTIIITTIIITIIIITCISSSTSSIQLRADINYNHSCIKSISKSESALHSVLLGVTWTLNRHCDAINLPW